MNRHQNERLVEALRAKAVAGGAIYIDSMWSGHGGNQSSIAACATDEGAMKWIQAQVDHVKKWTLGNAEGRLSQPEMGVPW